ncbi:TolC family protein [Paraburkholderia sp. LEh10]|uniref:TolC family protein n=1 Tax=Paraburkholderia sp. LEh10 TaxID=2821353 RepID=UPI001AE171DC|nr:TolC family protein [Paraburkholderia sp. LEh10]MBP0595566.1 TolC family protein [Paraburkholderia sp. LEh10]
MSKRSFSVLLLAAAATSAHAEPLAVNGDAGGPIVESGLPDERAQAALTLEDVLGIAARANPVLRGAREDVDASAGAFMQAGARPNPQLSLLQEGFSRGERTTTALVNQTIELGGKRRARLDVASYGRELALATLDGRAAALRAQVIAAFYGLLAAQRQLQVAEESADIAARSADLADRRARAGKVSPVEATKAKVAATGVQIDLINARARVSTAAQTLANATGSASVRARAVAGDLETVPSIEPLPQLLTRLDDAPLSRMAKAEMLRANAAVSVERARRVPDITISAGMKRVVTGGALDNQAVVGVSIPLPIFDSNKGALLEAAHKAEKASADFDGEKAGLQLELTRAYAGYESATQEAQRLKSDVLPAARDALNAMSRGYALGKFSFLDVLDAQRTLFQEQSRYVRSLMDAHAAYAELGRIIGTPLPSGLSPATSQP